ncbi:MAG: hypothetical protein H6R26_1138, partial [Proteobacteria bacterium]|nr:hypothetical protein [Pseudomonadota bacterium]
YRILELLRPMAELESGKLLAGIVGKPLPLIERLRNSAKLSAQFQAELARGFQSVAGDRQTASELSEDERASLVYRALSAYEQYLLRLALMYEDASPSLWSRVHDLYRLAAEFGYAGGGDSGVNEVFGRMLMFRLACPNRLDQDDIQRLNALLRAYGGLIDLKSSPTTGDAFDEFIVDLTSGAPPTRASAEYPLREGCRFLNAGRFRRQLALLMQPTVPESERLDEEFAVRVMVRLGGSPPYVAEQKGRRAMVALGLDSIVAMVLKAQRAESGNSWAGLDALELMPLSDHLGAHPPSGISKSAGTFSPGSSGTKSVKSAAGGEIWNRLAGEHSCHVFRSEVPGFYVLDAEGLALSPGKLAGLNTDNELIQVGVVGVAKPRGTGSLSVFELLANEVRTVRVFGPSVSTAYSALFAQGAGHGPCTLLGPPIKLRNGDAVELERGGRRDSYRVARLLENTDEFAQFELIPLDAAVGRV